MARRIAAVVMFVAAVVGGVGTVEAAGHVAPARTAHHQLADDTGPTSRVGTNTTPGTGTA